jgi:dTDP-4-amino-4,6-dideoxygalactose transaminase
MIPFNKPVWLGSEPERIREAICANGHVASGGPFGRACEERLAEQLAQPTLLMSSCTHALEASALLLEIEPGDRIVLPAFTYVSTATAFALRGAQLVFVDVDATGNIDLGQVEAALDGATRAVVAVHYGGNSCDMDALLALCGDVAVVEDAAQAIGAAFAGRALGSFGRLGAFSFHETKNIGCGEGGALTIGDPALLERANFVRDKGTDRSRFLAGLEKKYSWVDLGSSYGLSDLNAAYLYDQLCALEQIQARRAQVRGAYAAGLSSALERVGAEVVRGHALNTPNDHLFAVVFRGEEQRTRYIAHMRAHDIITPFHYVALHRSPMGKKHHGERGALPNSERLSDCLVRLPLFYNMSDAEVDEVIERTREFVDAA